MRVREEYTAISGQEKAALLLLSLGEEHTARVFEGLDSSEITEISQTMANLGKISSNVVEQLFMEFADNIYSSNSLVGSLDSTEKLLANALGKDRVSEIMQEIRGPAGKTMWDKISNVDEEVLSNFLQKEYPQTVAVILSKITSDHAARVLSLLPEGFALEVITRMLNMENVQDMILEDIEDTLKTEFMSNLSKTTAQDSYELMADIFNNLDRSAEARFMESLEERSQDAAGRIRDLMFTFEDLGDLDPSGIQTLIRSADKESIPIALKGATDTIKDLFFGNMSERAAKIMKEDMASMGPVRLKDVEESQQALVTVAKDLADRGEITLASKNEEDELIY